MKSKPTNTYRFHVLEYIEYNLPTNMHRPDLHNPIFETMERSQVRNAYSANFGVDFSDLTPEDAVRVLRGSFIPTLQSGE